VGVDVVVGVVVSGVVVGVVSELLLIVVVGPGIVLLVTLHDDVRH